MKYNKLGKFILILLMFFLTFPLFCEEGGVQKEATRAITEDSPIDTVRLSNNEHDIPLSSNEFTLRNDSDITSYTSHVVRLILSLGFVAFLAYVVVRFMKKSKLFVVNDDAYIKLVAQLNIEQGKSIKVFTIGEKAYIVGITSSNITKIAEIEDKLLIDAMNLKANENSSREVSSFSKVFSNFFPTAKPMNTTKEEIVGDDFLKKQQERIKNMNLNSE